MIRMILSVLVTLSLVGCAQNPVSGRNDFVMMSEKQEIAVGRQNDAAIRKQYRVYDNPALQNYVSQIGAKLAKQSHRPTLQYSFTVLDSPEINAFALPGGYVYVTRGILAYLNSEAELAAVLGHELGHVTARHGVRKQSAAQAANIGLNIAAIFIPALNTVGVRDLTSALSGAILSGYGRDHELQADSLGAEYLAREQYDPQAIISVIRVLKNQELFDIELAKQEGREPRRYHGLFASHPDNDTRLKQAINEAEKQKVAQPHDGREAFLAAVDGLVFNDSADQGIVRNQRFYHNMLGITLQFPSGWQVKNLPTSVLAVAAGNEVAVELREIERPQSFSPSEFVRQKIKGVNQIEHLNVNGFQGALFESEQGMAAVIFRDSDAFLIQLKAKSAQLAKQYRQPLLDTVHSFRKMTSEELKQVKPLSIRVVTAKSGDTFAKLAQSSPLGKSAESYLRLINAHYPDGEPKVGERIKIVE